MSTAQPSNADLPSTPTTISSSTPATPTTSLPTTTSATPTTNPTPTHSPTQTTLATPTTPTTSPAPSTVTAPLTPSIPIPTTAGSPSASSSPAVQTFFSTSTIIPNVTATRQSTSTLFIPAPTSSLLPTPSASSSRASANGFFSSKGRVAALFAFVGLLAIAIFFVAFTTIVRRRRAKQIDKDVVEAAMEAPATFHSANFDDYDDSPYTGYSADGRGAYPDEHRSAGVAGVGVAGGTPDEYPVFDDRSPYPAFSGPGPQLHEIYDRSGAHGNPDALEVAELGATAAPAAGVFINRHLSSDQHLSRNKSQGSMGLISLASDYSTASALPGQSFEANYQLSYDAAQQPHPPPPPPPPPQQQQQQLYAGEFSDGRAQEHPFRSQHTLHSPDPLHPHRQPSPDLPNPHPLYDTYSDVSTGAEHAGDEEGHAEREGEGRVSFEEDVYKRLPWVLQIAND